MIKFLKSITWKPDIVDVFAGRLDYPSLNFWDKQIIRLIMYITKGPIDLKKLMNLRIGTELKVLLKK